MPKRRMQHFIHHRAPAGMAGFVLANGSMSSNQSGEGEIRRAIIQADLVDCMVALPGQLFYSTQIPVCLWFLSKNKSRRVVEHGEDLPDCFRDRRREALFIDARKMGTLVDRVHRELTDADISKIVDAHNRRWICGRPIYHADTVGSIDYTDMFHVPVKHEVSKYSD